ncbi:unnamed protein product [Dibothriocephalus latus]|uniref:Uncharacterized protein n=1 Tax=Dibothriocephalus latus TaxID=60516 RepID=A0A3P7M2T9_DIBLA|nr:unnamed protein product [Dibothriocephalus latus]
MVYQARRSLGSLLTKLCATIPRSKKLFIVNYTPRSAKDAVVLPVSGAFECLSFLDWMQGSGNHQLYMSLTSKAILKGYLYPAAFPKRASRKVCFVEQEVQTMAAEAEELLPWSSLLVERVDRREVGPQEFLPSFTSPSPAAHTLFILSKTSDPHTHSRVYGQMPPSNMQDSMTANYLRRCQISSLLYLKCQLCFVYVGMKSSSTQSVAFGTSTI